MYKQTTRLRKKIINFSRILDIQQFSVLRIYKGRVKSKANNKIVDAFCLV